MKTLQEVQAFRNAISVQNLITQLRLMLEQDTNRAHVVHNKAPMEIHEPKLQKKGEAQVENQPVVKMQPHIRGRMAQMKTCWKELFLKFV